MDPKTEEKSKEYARIKHRLFFIHLFLSFLFIVIVLLTGISSWLVQTLEGFSQTQWIVTGLYALIAILFTDFISMPLSYYGEFYLEHRYELSNHTLRSWGIDHLKSLGLGIFFGVLSIEVLYLFLQNFTETWWIWTFAAWLFFSFVIGKLTPILLLPIFYKIEPIDDKELTDKLLRLADLVKAKIIGIYKMDMSKKTKKANAMFTGIGSTRRIIMGDTLLENFSNEEIEVILAHEMGHYYYKHILMQLVFGSVIFLTGLFLVDQLLGMLNPLFGFGGIDDLAALPLLTLILSVFFFLTMPFSNGFSRACERAADKFALRTTGDKTSFISAMEKLADQNLADREPPAWIEWLLHSHPSISHRVQMAKEFQVSNK